MGRLRRLCPDSRPSCHQASYEVLLRHKGSRMEMRQLKIHQAIAAFNHRHHTLN